MHIAATATEAAAAAAAAVATAPTFVVRLPNQTDTNSVKQ
jgi:hypothetical protein